MGRVSTMLDEIMEETLRETPVLVGHRCAPGGCFLPRATPEPGRYAMPFRGMHRDPLSKADRRCMLGIWYMPKQGDNLWTVARRQLLEGTDVQLSTPDYMRRISANPCNHSFQNAEGLATKAFLPIWAEDGRARARAGQKRGYGLLFLPALPKPPKVEL